MNRILYCLYSTTGLRTVPPTAVLSTDCTAHCTAYWITMCCTLYCLLYDLLNNLLLSYLLYRCYNGQVEGLKAQMCNALSTYLDHDNACSVFAAADSYQCQGLKGEAFSKIVQHFALTARSEGWAGLTKGQLSEVRGGRD